MLQYNAKTGDYFLAVTDKTRVEEAGLDLSTRITGPNGEPIYFTKEPYAVLGFYDEGTPEVKARLASVKAEYESSFATDANIAIPKPADCADDYMGFQRAGVDYATKRKHTLIGDEMGLGKTIQAIGFANKIGAERILVVCPASIRLNWKKQVMKWATVPRPHKINTILKSANGVTAYANYTIISYELAHNEQTHQALTSLDYDVLILDESHYLKTRDSRRSRATFGGGQGPFKERHLVSCAKHVIALTGTPLPNRPRECWTIAKAICPEAIDWTTFDQFCYRFNPSARGINESGKMFVREASGRLPELNARLRCNFMVRRMKDDVLKDLPDKRYEITYLETDGKVKEILRREKLIQFKPEDLLNPMCDIFGQISTIRREMGEALIPQFVRHAKMLLEVMEVEKLPIFFHHRSVMNAFRDAMAEYGVVEIRGGMTPEAKQASVDEFVSNPKIRIFSGQLDSAGFGVDGLQEVANHLVIAEPSWVPGTNEQVVARLHRIGQHRSVLAQMMAVEGSILDRILGTMLDKVQTIHSSIDHRLLAHAAELEELLS